VGADPGAPAGCIVTSATFSARLKDARESAGMSLQGLADASGTSHSSVRIWLAGRAEPSIGNSAKLAEALGVSPCWLAYGCECNNKQGVR
jgi:transcriptional regulator with XRE-family HTH domain